MLLRFGAGAGDSASDAASSSSSSPASSDSAFLPFLGLLVEVAFFAEAFDLPVAGVFVFDEPLVAFVGVLDAFAVDFGVLVLDAFEVEARRGVFVG